MKNNNNGNNCIKYKNASFGVVFNFTFCPAKQITWIKNTTFFIFKQKLSRWVCLEDVRHVLFAQHNSGLKPVASSVAL